MKASSVLQALGYSFGSSVLPLSSAYCPTNNSRYSRIQCNDGESIDLSGMVQAAVTTSASQVQQDQFHDDLAELLLNINNNFLMRSFDVSSRLKVAMDSRNWILLKCFYQDWDVDLVEVVFGAEKPNNLLGLYM